MKWDYELVTTKKVKTRLEEIYIKKDDAVYMFELKLSEPHSRYTIDADDENLLIMYGDEPDGIIKNTPCNKMILKNFFLNVGFEKRNTRVCQTFVDSENSMYRFLLYHAVGSGFKTCFEYLDPLSNLLAMDKEET